MPDFERDIGYREYRRTMSAADKTTTWNPKARPRSNRAEDVWAHVLTSAAQPSSSRRAVWTDGTGFARSSAAGVKSARLPVFYLGSGL